MRCSVTLALVLATVGLAGANPKGAAKVPPAKLEDPCRDSGCSSHALDHFTAALAKQRAGTADRPLRIAYFGDSLTASDSIAHPLREKLGALLGAGGPGFVWAAEPHPYNQQRSVALVTGGTWQVHGVSTAVPADRLLGLGGSAEGSGTIAYRPAAPIASIDVHYLEQPRGGTFAIVADGAVLAEVDTAGPKKQAAYRKVDVPAATKPQRVELRARGRVRLFGATLEARRGAVVDNLGIVNGTAKGMAKYNLPEHLRGQLAHRAADLVVVMYGTNEAEWLAPRGAGMEEHERLFGELLATIRAASPDTSCLVVSPLDQLDWRTEQAPPRASIPAMVEAQQRAAKAAGCAFWSVYDWMGGKGSSATWFKRGLVMKDFQHPTTQGAQRIADALYAALVER